MAITDIFLKKPVLSISINAFILCIGLFCCFKLPISQFPQVSSAVINITTAYPGANQHLVAGMVTSPIETAIANAEGIDYVTSKSLLGQSTISVHLKLNTNVEKVLLDIINKLEQVSNQLPNGSLKPVVEKKSDAATALMYISLLSTELSSQTMTDYASRVIQPQLNNLEGVAKIDIIGGKKYALRVIINPLDLAAHSLTTNDIVNVLNTNQYMTAAGQTENEFIATPLAINTDLQNLQAFKNLIITCPDGSTLHLKDIAKVRLGAENYDDEAKFDGKKSIFLAVTPTPTANPLIVIQKVRQQLPILQSQFPNALSAEIVYDATKYIKAALFEVACTLLEAVCIVIAVIYLFLGSWRAVLIPVITIPFSLIGMATFMYAFNCSINLLTLLAFVLAIGLVVDDAIVVVENIHRHFCKHGQILKACFEASAEIAKPVIGMTITLAAVFAPIAFSQGLTGSLFKEFALTLAGTVLLSGVIAITLSPLLNSKILSHQHHQPNRIFQWFQNQLEKFELLYFKKLSQVLQTRTSALILLGFSFMCAPFLYHCAAHETAPEEDQGFFFVASSGQTQSTKISNRPYTEQIEDIFKQLPETAHYFILNSATPFSGLVLEPWKKRDKSQFKLKQPLQQQLNDITGLNSYAIIPPALPGGGEGAPFQMVLQSFGPLDELVNQSELMLREAKKLGLFIFINNNLKINQIHYQLKIDRKKAAALGFNMTQIGQMLSGALANGQVNYFALNDKRYIIVPRLAHDFRFNPEQILELNLLNQNRQAIPLSNFVSLVPKFETNVIAHFQQANSATLEGVPMPGVSMGEVIVKMQQLAQSLPKQIHYDFSGQSRQFLQEQSSLLPVFLLAIMCIYLVLSIQYNSFRDPLIILTSLPLTFCGALLPLFFGLSSVNIYTQIGLLTLIGLISKHGILIVDFANQLKHEFGYTAAEAVIEAAKLRLRPILMTTSAMIFGVIPLLFADGAGAKSRMAIGLIISFGMGLGTLFTLFVVPCIYSFISKDETNPMPQANPNELSIEA
jgi:multidrug efflux pump